MEDKDGKIYLNGKVVAAKGEWTLSNPNDYAGLTPGRPGELIGLKDVQGSFSGPLDLSGDDFTQFGDTVRTMYLYTPKHLSWWRHLIARFNERFREIPYPTDVVQMDAVNIEATDVDEEGETFTVTFNARGGFKVDDK